MTDIYDQIPAGEYVKWDTVGQTVTGDVIEVSLGQSLQGDKVPQYRIRLDDGTECTVTASQGQLKALCLKEKPHAGDRVKIVHTGVEKREGGKLLKLFTLDVKVGGAKAPVAVAEDEF